MGNSRRVLSDDGLYCVCERDYSWAWRYRWLIVNARSINGLAGGRERSCYPWLACRVHTKDGENTVETGTFVVVMATFVAYLALVVTALVQIGRSRRLNETTQVLWVLVVIIAPLIGSIVWFVIGRQRSQDLLP